MARGRTRPYHHGNLAAALVEAALEMAAEGGPECVVLREVARRVGVSPTAAYRHFAGQADLADAVKQAALTRLAEHMRAALAGSPEAADAPDGRDGRGASGDPAGPTGPAGRRDSGVRRSAAAAGRVPLPGVAPDSPQEHAIRRLESVGRAYFDFAITQPGLFRCFCIGLPEVGPSGPASGGPPAPAPGAAPAAPPLDGPAPPAGQRPPLADEAAFGVLAELLDDLVTAGVLTEARRAAGVDIALWSAVHGLSVLCLDGPLAEMPREQQYAMLTAVTDVVFHGLAGADR